MLPTIAYLYEIIARVGKKKAARRMRLAGQCQRHQELPNSNLVLWGTNTPATLTRTCHANTV